MKKTVVVILAMAAALGAAQPALALGGARIEKAFKKFDTNGDGAITLDEWLGAGRKESGFKTIDTDGDGRITLDEMKAAIAKFRDR